MLKASLFCFPNSRIKDSIMVISSQNIFQLLSSLGAFKKVPKLQSQASGHGILIENREV